MPFTNAARTRLVALGFSLGAAGLALAGCGSIDESLFGSSASAPASATPPAQTSEAAPAPESAPASDTGMSSETAPPTPPPSVADLGMSLAAIEPGNDTGTAVGQTVTRLRGELSTVHDKVAEDIQKFATLKGAATQDVTTYQESKSHIVIRLQVGTTKGNPELVNAWNTAQSSLDTLTGGINGLATLGTELTADAGRARTERDTIADAFNMAGGTDEDRRQLTVLQQEADQMVGSMDRLEKDVSRNVQRQTAFIANERASLTRLQTDIKNGELYSSSETEMAAAPAAAPSSALEGSKAIDTIRFARAKVDYEQDLYTALNQALQAKPSATFSVMAVSPTGGSAAAVQKAQREAQRHAQDVLKSMTDMGVPAARVAISSSTDPSVSATEVRVYEK